MRAAVVGHVEWMEFVPVELVPRPGEIVHTAESGRRRGGVAAVQFGELADSVQFFTALGTDERGRRAKVELEERGIEVHASSVDGPQRSGFTFVDKTGEGRSPRSAGSCTLEGMTTRFRGTSLARCEAVYFCAGDADALLLARRGRVLVATARELATLGRAPSSSTPW